MDNYFDTAERMRDSSKTLHTNANFHNSCYLGGYVIESYLKQLLEFGGIRHGIHILGDLDRRIQDYIAVGAAASNVLSKYKIDMTIECPYILQNWTVGGRYAEKSNSWDQNMSEEFQKEIDKCYNKIVTMLIDNVL